MIKIVLDKTSFNLFKTSTETLDPGGITFITFIYLKASVQEFLSYAGCRVVPYAEHRRENKCTV